MTKLTMSKTLEVFDEDNIKSGDILRCRPKGYAEKITVMVKEVSPFELIALSLTHELIVSKSHFLTIKPSDVDSLQVEIVLKGDVN